MRGSRCRLAAIPWRVSRAVWVAPSPCAGLQRRPISWLRVAPTRFRAPQQSVPFLVRTFLWRRRWTLLALLALLGALWAVYHASPLARRTCRFLRRTGAAARLGVRLAGRAAWYLRSDRSSVHHRVHEANAQDIRAFIECHGAGTVYSHLLQLFALASPYSPLFGVDGGLDPLLYSTYVNLLTPVLHDDQAIIEALEPPAVARALAPLTSPASARPPVAAYDEVPFACHPLAQYHRCRLADGGPAVAVVRHRRNAPFVAADLLVLRALAGLADWVADAPLCAPSVAHLTELCHAEADFAQNRHTLHLLHRLFRRSWRIAVPRPLDDCCSDDVLLLPLPRTPTAPLGHPAEVQALGGSARSVGSALAELSCRCVSGGLALRGVLSGAGVGALGDSVLCTRRGIVVLSAAAFRTEDAPMAGWEREEALLRALPVVTSWRWGTVLGLAYSEHEEVNLMHALLQSEDESALPLFFGLQTSLYAQKLFRRADTSALQFCPPRLVWGAARAAFARRRHRAALPSALLAVALAALGLPAATLALLWAAVSYRLAGVRRAAAAVLHPPAPVPLLCMRKQ